MKINYKQLEYLHPLLRAVLSDLEEWLWFEPTITSQYRMNTAGVHGTLPLRATDIRCKDASVGRVVEEYLNKRWKYDPERPEKEICIFHDAGTGWHLHVQVHPNTSAIEP